ncbi:hypothetical protein ABEG75_22755 [Pantoea agglomerans]|uniref:hypothetical protein n=1 Tax=Enterobacter agglomerans TaxID=549 RepID=UPI00165484E1|nr:hypothetical protein [Pantoea agglomerans]
MRFDSIVTVGDFMRYCRMPYWYQAKIKSMRIGDVFYIGKVNHPFTEDGESEGDFICEAWIEKERGVFHFYATFTMPTKNTRPFIMANCKIKIDIKGNMEFSGMKDSLLPFVKVSRYLDFFLRHMSLDEKNVFYKAGAKPLLSGVCIDKNNIGRDIRHVRQGDKLVRQRIDFSNHLPTHQLEAIVTAALHLKQIDLNDL